MWLRPKEMTEVYIPLAFHVERGFTKITIEISTQLLQKQEILEIEILPEGSLVHKHTSVLLDLKNRAHVLQFMKIPVDEKEIIPYEIFRYKSISRIVISNISSFNFSLKKTLCVWFSKCQNNHFSRYGFFQ